MSALEVSKMSLGQLVEEKLLHYLRLNETDLKGANIHQYVIEEVEKTLLRLVLEKTKGNQMKAADILGINRNTLRKKMRLYKILVK